MFQIQNENLYNKPTKTKIKRLAQLYSASRPEKACTIYCKQVRTPEYTSPQLYLAESDGVDLFFPDGTLCHNDGVQNYYCLKHQCIPADQSRSPRKSLGPEVPVFQVFSSIEKERF